MKGVRRMSLCAVGRGVNTVAIALFVSTAGLCLFVISMFEGRHHITDTGYMYRTMKRVHHLTRRDVTSYMDDNGTLTSSDDLWNSVYQYREFKKKYPLKDPTICYNKKGFEDNGTKFYNFTCPMSDQGPEMSECCGQPDDQKCCQKSKDKSTNNDMDIITAISIVAAFVVSMSLCLVLYCCCCQRRGELHSGRLIWIKKKKNKMIYEEGGVSPGGSIGDPDEEDVELVGFIQVPDKHIASHSPLGSRKSIEVAIAEAEKHQREKEKEQHAKHKHHHHKGQGSPNHHHGHHHHDNDKNKTDHDDKGTESPKLDIPLINVQPSTPEPPADDSLDNKTDETHSKS